MENGKKYNWTIMVYLAGDNNLSSEMVFALTEMTKARVGPEREVAVVAQFDPQGGEIPTQRYIINHDRSFSAPLSLAADALLADKEAEAFDEVILPEMLELVSKTPDRFPALAQTVISDPSRFESFLAESSTEKETLLRAFADPSLTDDTGNPWTLLRFLFWGVKRCPADHYMVVLSGHGSGSDGDFLNDDSSGGSLTVRGLSEVLRLFGEKLKKPIDILGLDTCLMSMAEVYYQVAESVNFLIGSEGVAPNTGWPYHEILELFAKNSTREPEYYAREIVAEYKRFYMNYALGGVSADIAACNASNNRHVALKDSVLALSKELLRQLRDSTTSQNVADALLIAHWTAQTYKFDQYVDLLDFCAELARRKLEGISGLAQDVVDVISKKIVLEAATVGPLFQYSYGLSVYFPWAQVSKEYENLCFARDAKWAEFLELHVEKTSRRERRCHCDPPGNEVLKAIFNPKPMKSGIPRVSPVGAGRDGDGCKHSSTRFTAPCDRGPGVRFSSVKNPPIAWCPGCPEEPKE